MPSGPIKNRLRRRISFELCEPRQLLSAEPVAYSQTAFAVQVLDLRIATEIALAPTNETGFGSGQFIVLNSSADAFGHDNMYGTNLIPFSSYALGIATNDANFSPAFFLDGFSQPMGNVIWQSVPPPQLDPFPPSPPGFSPIHHNATESAFVSFPICSPASVNSIDSVTSLLASSATVSAVTLKAESPGSAAAGSSKGQWLSATFSPVEQHRLDATMVDADYEQAMATRDPRSRFALEPTRVTCQTFCFAANTHDSARSKAGQPSNSVPGQPHARTGKAQPRLQPQHKAKLEAASEAKSPAIRDVAILHWESPDQPAHCVLVAATGPGDQIAASRELRIDAPPEREDLDSFGRNAIVRFLEDNRFFAGLLLTAFTTTSFWPYDNDTTFKRPLRSPGRTIEPKSKRRRPGFTALRRSPSDRGE